jgi:type I restriction enzyme S subunit
MAVSQHIIAWTPNPGMLMSEFLLRVFAAMEQYLDSFTMGSTIKTIGMPDVRKLTFALPPFDEQIEIIKFVGERFSDIDMLVVEAQRAIELLRERRSALISAAVTGQIDVRYQSRN